MRHLPYNPAPHTQKEIDNVDLVFQFLLMFLIYFILCFTIYFFIFANLVPQKILKANHPFLSFRLTNSIDILFDNSWSITVS